MLPTEVTPTVYRLDLMSSHRTYISASGEHLPGVTTVLQLLNKPALLHWAWKLGRAGVNMEASRQNAATVGTVAHALCEAFLRGMEFDGQNIAPETLAQAQNGLRRFREFWEREQLTVVATELPMISEAMQVGGTLDILGKRPDNRLVVVDLKSSSAIYDEMLIQGATYAAMYEEISGQEVADVLIVRIGKEDADDLEVRTITKRKERVEAFAALATARRLLKAAGVKV